MTEVSTQEPIMEKVSTQVPIVEEVSTQEPIVAEVSTQVPTMEEVGTQEFTMEDVVLEDYVSFGEDVEQCNGQFDESAPSDGHFFYEDEGIDTAYETEYDVQSSEDAGIDDDDDDDDEDFFMQDDVLEGDYVDVINTDGFDSDLGNDDEIINYRRRRLAELSREMKDKNDTGLNHGMESGPSGSSGPPTRSKKRKNTGTNDDSQASSSVLDAHDKGDLT
ncbi:hypothetical protein Tco_1222948 [Tanacetum coccineum]